MLWNVPECITSGPVSGYLHIAGHGADDGSMMMHLAISLGKTTWMEEVGQEEYEAKSG